MTVSCLCLSFLDAMTSWQYEPTSWIYFSSATLSSPYVTTTIGHGVLQLQQRAHSHKQVPNTKSTALSVHYDHWSQTLVHNTQRPNKAIQLQNSVWVLLGEYSRYFLSTILVKGLMPLRQCGSFQRQPTSKHKQDEFKINWMSKQSLMSQTV